MYVPNLFSRGIVFPQEAWGPDWRMETTGVGLTNRVLSMALWKRPLFFHESVDHRGLRGAIPYTRCLCDAWDKLQDNVSNQGMKKQGGRGSQFTEHGCETEHEKS